MATTASKIKEIEDEMSKTQKNKVSGARKKGKHRQMTTGSTGLITPIPHSPQLT